MRFVFERDTVYSVPPQELFEFHERPDAFRVLSPQSMNVDVETTATTLVKATITLALGFLFQRVSTFANPRFNPTMDRLMCFRITSQMVRKAARIPMPRPMRTEKAVTWA